MPALPDTSTSFSAPTVTDTVNQNFFIEALGGPQDPVSYLDRFPDAVYSKALDSILVIFLYSLLGPSGVGFLRREYLEARLQIEESGFSTANLDALYTNPFAFVRLAEETYDIDASAQLLSAQDAAAILASDASFRNRAILFLRGIRAGGTREGFSLIAQSALNRPVEVIENYNAIYDQHCDLPLGLSILGSTNDLNEVIIIPRQEIPQNIQQTLTISGEPVSGWFTLTVPLGPTNIEMLVGTSSGNILQVPDSTAISEGTYLSITSNTGSSITTGPNASIFAQVFQIIDGTHVSLIEPPYNPSAGSPLSPAIGSLTWAYIGNSETIPLPFNAGASNIQEALQDLQVIGDGNVNVTGGPLPDQPIVITFTNQLADQNIPAIQVNVAADSTQDNGLGSTYAPVMLNASGSSLDIVGSVVVDTVGIDGDALTTIISPANEHAMGVALDQIRPQTSLVTTKFAPSITKRIEANTIFGGQTQVEVIRYETGRRTVKWPAVDKVHWIEKGKEHEGPSPIGSHKYHYRGFHNIKSIYSYTEAALLDGSYSNDIQDIWMKYWDNKVGIYTQEQRALYPYLRQFNDPTTSYGPDRALAVTPDPLVITDRVGDTPIINDIYPTDYFGLHNIPYFKKTGPFWGTTERPGNVNAVDYLEIDLGSPQAVNYIYFEATNKPFDIALNYDNFDQYPTRNFVNVNVMPNTVAKSRLHLSYNNGTTRPWTPIEIHFTNSLNQMIFTRNLRLAFTRRPAHSPFLTNGEASIIPLRYIPYSLEIRNLRVGRNLAGALDRVILSA